MTVGFSPKLYTNNLLLVLIYVLLTYCSCKVASSSGVNNNHVQCVESEREALLHFKQGIRVDHCRYLDGWGHNQDCCQWRGIRCNNHSGDVIGLKLPGHFISLRLPGSGAYNYNYEPCLEGQIPIGTQLQSFDASSYMGNPGLCGAPLPSCVADEATAITPNGDGREDKKEDFMKEDFMLGLYISVVLGFIVGFWGVCGTLVVKRSWRQAYFRFYEDTRDKIYVIWVVKIARAWRRS